MEITGTTYAGALGAIPTIKASTPKPNLTNGGWNVFNGQDKASLPGLSALLESGELACPSGYVEIHYADGQTAVLFASCLTGDEVYGFC